MGYIVGIGTALAVSTMAALAGLDRDRAFYPTVLIVVASYYILFAVMGGTTRTLVVEGLIMAGFVAMALVGFRGSLWLVVTGLFAHGVQDFFHGSIVTNPGVPVWWAAFCGSYDVIAAAILAWLIVRRRALGGGEHVRGGRRE